MRKRPIRSRQLEPLEQRLLLARLLGIDVSHWDGVVNWNTVHTVGGKDFAYIKATDGLDVVDSQFLNNVNASSGAQAKGLYSGFYHFPNYNESAANTANAEADHFFDTVKPYLVANGKTMQPVLDVERPLRTGWTTADMVQWVNDWCNRVKSRAATELGLSVTPLLYSSKSRAGDTTFWNSTVTQSWPLWVAQWPTPTVPDPQTTNPSGTGFWSEWPIWQYAADPDPPNQIGTCPGVGGGTAACDLDVLNGDAEYMKDYVIGAAGYWPDGARVQVTASSLNVWSNSTCNSSAPYNDTTNPVPMGTLGTILDGPVFGNANMRYKIHYDNGVVGWSAERYLVSVTPGAASNPSLASGSVVKTLPATFTWTAGANASLYDVYLDGVLQTQVTSNSWTHGAIGQAAHTWQVIARNGSVTTAGSTWSFTYDATAPTASYGNQIPTAGSSTFDFTVIYTDPISGLDASSLTNGDLTVTGPNSYSAAATFISVTPSGNGSPRTATYRITAPGGTWESSDNGTYTLTQVASEVRDLAANYRPAGSIGTFAFSVQFAYMTGSTLNVTFDGTTTPILLMTSGSNINVIRNGSTSSFAAAGISAISVIGTANPDELQLLAPLAPPLTFTNNGGDDSVAVVGGTYTFASDLSPSLRNIAVTVDAGAAAIFSSNQHLRSLTINGSATLPAGEAITLVTGDMVLSGKIDINDNALAVDYTTVSNLGAWNGTNYTGIAGLITTGRNGGSWNGSTGIVTSMTAAKAPSTRTTIGVAEASDALSYGGGATASWRGETIDTTCVLVRYTWAGDANLSGTIDGDDYFAIDAHFNGDPGTPRYSFGDFDMNGRRDADDYFLIDSNYNKGTAPPMASLPLALVAQPASVFSAAPITSAYHRLIAGEPDAAIL